jgi:hypothetical protein
MQAFPHFHWISIEGKRPNIPENFIRDTTISIRGVTQEKEQKEVKEQESTNLKGVKVVPPIIHNISKELQIFLDNFEQRFHKEIKNSKLNSNPIFAKSKELEVSLNVIENEPGVVELIPYIIEFLMTSLTNKQYLGDSKVHMIILHYVDALLRNSFFYLEPYLHQILSLVLSLILMENISNVVDLNVCVKNFAVGILKNIFDRFETKYPNFINQLLAVFKANIIPDKTKPAFLTVYGAIKALNILGPCHIIDIVLPNIEVIFNSLINYSAEESSVESQLRESLNPSQDQTAMMVDLPESLPKITFSMPDYLNVANIPASIFSEVSNTILIKDDKKVQAFLDLKHKKINPNTLKKVFYAYGALKVILFSIIRNLQHF